MACLNGICHGRAIRNVEAGASFCLQHARCAYMLLYRCGQSRQTSLGLRCRPNNLRAQQHQHHPLFGACCTAHACYPHRYQQHYAFIIHIHVHCTQLQHGMEPNHHAQYKRKVGFALHQDTHQVTRTRFVHLFASFFRFLFTTSRLLTDPDERCRTAAATHTDRCNSWKQPIGLPWPQVARVLSSGACPHTNGVQLMASRKLCTQLEL